MNNLALYNSLGIIPGPGETDECFTKRAEFCLALKEKVREELGPELPFAKEDSGSENAVADACKLTEDLYGISPAWLPVFISDFRLMPWHGACAWNFEFSPDAPMGTFIQMRKNFFSIQRYLNLYNQTELLAHEMCHAGRMLFNEPKFEEILAYRVFKNPFYRYLGPIIQSPKESLVFVLLIVLVFLVDIFSIAYPLDLSFVLWLRILPFALIGLGLGRLASRQHSYKKCVRNLAALTGNLKSAHALAYRLTDKEMLLFAKSEQGHMASYIRSADSLRWKMIKEIYLAK